MPCSHFYYLPQTSKYFRHSRKSKKLFEAYLTASTSLWLRKILYSQSSLTGPLGVTMRYLPTSAIELNIRGTAFLGANSRRVLAGGLTYVAFG